MTTISEYNQTRKLFANGEVSLGDLKVMLRNASTVFNAAHTVIGDLAGAEVSGNGWAAGGEAIANAAVTITDTNGATLDGDNISVVATGGTIGPAPGAVVIDASTNRLLFFLDFEGSQEAGDGTPFNVNWHVDGIHRWQAAA